jgi:Flavodoxin
MSNTVLVIYFSRTGNTRRVAEQLALELGGQACAITEATSRQGFIGYSRCLWDSLLRRDAAINPLACKPAQAELVVIGTPIWAWHLASPVRSFVRRHRVDIKRCAFFCTMGGSGSEAAFDELCTLTSQLPLATLALTDLEVTTGTGQAKVNAFVASLQGALHKGAEQAITRV